jgi:Na+(H+)/acetate symporter ActP
MMGMDQDVAAAFVLSADAVGQEPYFFSALIQRGAFLAALAAW